MCGELMGQHVAVHPDTLPGWAAALAGDVDALDVLIRGELVIVWVRGLQRSPTFAAVGVEGRLPDGRLRVKVRQSPSPWRKWTPPAPGPPDVI